MPVPPRHRPPTARLALPHLGDTPGEQREEAMSRQEFFTLGLISLFLMLGPFLIWHFWAKINGWGWWKPGSPYNSNNHTQYIRTWHGWVTAEHYENGLLRRNVAREKLRKKFAWKSSKADYSWIFWDPDGTRRKAYEESRKPLTRWLPAWVRSWEFGTVFWRKGDRKFKIRDPEQGIIPIEQIRTPVGGAGSVPFRPNRRVKSGTHRARSVQLDGPQSQAYKSTSRAPMIMGLPSNTPAQYASTVRRRPAHGPSPAWTLESMQVEVVSTQPIAEHQRRQARSTEDEPLPITHWPSMSASIEDLGLPSIHRAHSMPLISSRDGGHGLTKALSSHSLDLARLPQSETLFSARPVEGPSAPNSSEDVPTPRGFTPPEGVLSVQFGTARRSATDANFTRNLNRSLQIWAQPLLLNPYASVGPENCGTAGRRPSPAMGWTTIGSDWNDHLEDMRSYENDGGLVMTGSDSSSIDNWEPFPTYGSTKPKKPIVTESAKDMIQHWHRKPSVTPSKRIVCGYGEETFVPAMTAAPKWYEKHRQGLSCPESQCMIHTSRPKIDRALHVSPVTSPLLPSPKRSVSFILPTGETYLPARSEGRRSIEVVGPRRMLSLPEKSFLDCLQRKLTWLSFELAPGFRGPEDNPAESWKAPLVSHSRFSANVVSRATETQKRMLTRSGARRTEGPLGTHLVRGKIELRNIDDWKNAVNMMRLVSGENHLLRGVMHYQGDTPEPREEDIDTAAWILRRPPQGFEPTDLGVNAYYTGIKGYAEKMWEWEVVRRPYVLERMMQRHQGHHQEGMGGAMIRRVSTALGIVAQSEDAAPGEKKKKRRKRKKNKKGGVAGTVEEPSPSAADADAGDSVREVDVQDTAEHGSGNQEEKKKKRKRRRKRKNKGKATVAGVAPATDGGS